MPRHTRLVGAAVVAAALLAGPFVAAQQSPPPDIALFVQAASQNSREANDALDRIAEAWKDGYASLLYDLMRVINEPRPAPDDPGLDTSSPFGDPEDRPGAGRPSAGIRLRDEPPIRSRILRFLGRQTGQRFGNNRAAWQRWIWSLPYDPHPDYARFKGIVYSAIDPRFERFFPPGVRSLIRLDEIDWGGVPVNGIPPLVYPNVVEADEAGYLGDGNVVFGISLNGEARAYPKRILAWHEMARDRVGGVELTVVYCTLCGTVMPYRSVMDGRLVRFGTSGLLYRSNKLMFDEETHSLWSALEGKPVVGPLVDSGLALVTEPVVTTTWREWKREHPQTTVLSIDTGFRRNYAEGEAYRDYFSTDRLMFQVSKTDSRLRNKAEVVVMRVPAEGGERPVAISADLLKRQPVFHFDAADRRFVVITSPAGANRVYAAGDERFGKLAGDGLVVDRDGRRWRITEDALVSEDGPERRLERFSAQRAFWFGWYAQFPDTLLLK